MRRERTAVSSFMSCRCCVSLYKATGFALDVVVVSHRPQSVNALACDPSLIYTHRVRHPQKCHIFVQLLEESQPYEIHALSHFIIPIFHGQS